MKILSWNILHGGGSRVSDILKVIESHSPDFVCLQEFRVGKHTSQFVQGLSEYGLDYKFIPDTSNGARNTVAVFSKTSIDARSRVNGEQGSSRIVECVSGDSLISFNVFCVSFPHKKEQIPVFESLLELDVGFLESESLLIGDFNCGIPFEDSETRSFYATHLFQALLKKGWVDSWRTRNPKVREFTWFSTQKGNGFRYDHVLVSPTLNSRIQRVWYDHEPREQRVSDHSVLLLELT